MSEKQLDMFGAPPPVAQSNPPPMASPEPPVQPPPPSPPPPTPRAAADPARAFREHLAACRKCHGKARQPDLMCAMGAELDRLQRRQAAHGPR